MDINVKLYNPFVAAMNKMRARYGEEFERLNGFHNTNLNFTEFIDGFIDSNNVADATIDANANANSKDICSLMAEVDKPHTKLLAYNKIFFEIVKQYDLKTAKQWLELEWNGAFYLHDAPSSSFVPYCFAYDLEDLATKGLFFVDDFGGGPPKHFPTFVQHVKEFVSWTSNRTSGACGLPNLLIYCYYFWREDVKNGYVLKNPSYHRDQHFQELIYALNQPYLRINQSAFTNVTIMDRPYLMEIFGGRTFPDGSFIVDDIEELIEFQKAFMEVVSRIRRETMFTFPVLTYSLLRKDGEFVDDEFSRWCNRHNMQWCDSNFFMSEDVTSLSSCCRLINDFSKLDGFINSIGGTALKIGSVKVNTINLARIALEAETEEEFFEILQKRVDLCVKTLHVVRSIIKRNIEKGLLPNYTSGLIDLKNQYNTIGISALYEAVYGLGYIMTDEFGNHSYTEKGLDFASKILDAINAQKDSYDFDYSINIEAVPAERAAVILCKKDSLLYPDNHLEREMYGNQWIPLDVRCTLDEKIRLGAILDKKCGGGQIMHVNIEGPFANEEQAWKLLNHIANEGVIYFAYNLKINVCAENHGFIGDRCTVCGGKPVDTYQRIVGFLTPSKSYSKERRIEFAKRYWFDLND